MAAENEADEGAGRKLGWPFRILAFLGYGLLIFAVGGVVVRNFDPKHGVDLGSAAYLTVVGLVLVLISGGHALAEFGLTSPIFGVTGKIRRVIREARDLTGELREVAALVGGESVRQLIGGGRWGGDGSSSAEKYDRAERILDILAKLGVPASEIAEIRSSVRPFDIVDYVEVITTMAEARRTSESNAKWTEFLGAFKSIERPDAEALRAFMIALGVHDDEMEEWIKDYAHYRRTGEHRRVESFRNREEVVERYREQKKARRN